MPRTPLAKEAPGQLNDGQKAALKACVKDGNIRAIYDLLVLPWFHRLWIVQEFALPRQLKLFLGSSFVDFEDVHSFAKVLLYLFMNTYLSSDSKDPNNRNISDFVFLCALREDVQSTSQSKENLLDCVRDHSTRACENDRDRIFGLLGLSTTADLDIEADYGKSTESIYFDFAYRFLERGQIVVLHLASRKLDRHWNSQKETPACLPSWVPDWRFSKLDVSIYLGSLATATELSSSFILEKSKLPYVGVTGTRLDVVTEEISTIFPGTKEGSVGNFWIYQPHCILQIENYLLNYFSKHQYPTGEDFQLAFARTMIADNRILSTQMQFSAEIPLQSLLTWKYMRSKITNINANNTPEVQHPAKRKEVPPYQVAARIAGVFRNFFISSLKYIGIGPLDTKPGDVIVAFDGDKTPFVLRKVTHSQTFGLTMAGAERFVPDEKWELVGECYFHGFMDNVVTETKYREKRETFWIT